MKKAVFIYMDPLTDLAKSHFNIDYLFPYQRLVISNILEAANAEGFSPELEDRENEEDYRLNQMVILPTGAGKSLCFMLPALLLDGITLIIFPLLSLLSDQQRRIEDAGMKSAILRGGQNSNERNQIFKQAAAGDLCFLLSNPETILSPGVLTELQKLNISHLVIDETHTVSEWGNSFRPVYLEVGKLPGLLNIRQVTAFTATASPLVLKQVKAILFPKTEPHLVAGNPDRTNVSYQMIPTVCPDHDIEYLLRPENPNALKRPALVFCRTRRSAEHTALELRRRLNCDSVRYYHAGLEKSEKKDIEEWFFASNDGILAATCAYGMGVDKSNIRTVIHRSPSPSVESYLQESGRAGRDREKASAVMLFSEIDRRSCKQISDPVAKSRFSALLDVAQDTKTCRRLGLLKLLGSEPEACFGCDVCKSNVQKKPQGYARLRDFLQKNKLWNAVTEKQARFILAGTGSRILQELSDKPGFGSMSDWRIDDICDAINLLAAAKQVRVKKRGIGKGALQWIGKVNSE